MAIAGSPASVAVLAFPNYEPLDLVGPFETFAIARPAEEHPEATALFTVQIVSTTSDTAPIRGFGGLRVVPDTTVADSPAPDILVIPGGAGVVPLLDDQPLLAWLRDLAARGTLMTSVCTGAFVLGAAGLLAGRRVTTHWSSFPYAREHVTDAEFVPDVRFIDEGSVITAAGVSAGIDMALHVVERLHGREAAAWTARLMEYERTSDQHLVGERDDVPETQGVSDGVA